MKRVVSILLAATLMLTSGTVTYATEENPVQMEYQTEGQDAVQAVNGTEQAPLKDIGVVQVSIAPGITLQKSVTFTVGLSGQESQSIELAANQEIQDTKGTVHFSQLPAGTYELTVAAPGFATYTQTIEVNSKSYAVNLMTGFVEGYTYEEGDYHPGVLLIGDVTGDGVIDDTDRSVLVDAIDTEQASELTDLTGDQKTDLADLEYFAKGYQAEGHTLACIEESVSADAISPKPGEDTNVEGNLEDLLKGEGNVTLSTQGGTEISEEHPVSVEFDLSESADTQIDGILIETNKENPIQKATVDITYIDAEGNEQTVTAPIENGVEHLLRTSDVQVSMDEDGNIQIHLGSQIAVKKVTLTIQGMQNNNNLAEISKVEFVNGMENRIPKPDMDIPTNLAVETGSEEFTLTWDACKNVTGYEVLIEHNGEQDTYTVKNNSLKVTSFNEKKLVNKEQYTAKVQSVNGTWKSGYSESVTAVPKADKKPDAPENVKAVGKYKSVEVSWKNMKNTEFYNLFYREKGQEEYTKIENITTNSYTISELKENVKYEIYLTGVNELGESDPSLTSTAQTTDLEPAVMPKYKQINTSEEGQVSSHIVSATRGRGEMKDSPLDLEGKTAWGTVDNNPASHFYMADWDDGGEYTDFNNKGFTFEFDQPYTMDTIGFQEVTAQGNFTRISLKYWDENGSEHVVDKNNLKIEARTDKNNKRYYFMGLYEDELHTVLKGSVTEQTIQDLRNRLQTKDEASGEYHPDKDRLEKELDNAEDILNNQLSEPILVHNTITTRDTDRGFSGLNAWQPLGITAAAGEEITLFVGHNTMGTGSNTNLQLVATQYHAESGSVSKVVTTLKTGRNDVTIPKIWSTDEESGGALYIQYTGNNANDRYSVRVNGGVEVPTLDLYGVTDAQERQQRAEQYVEALKGYVEKMEAVHKKVHENSGNESVEYEYSKENCILGATDILLDKMLFSLPAQQVLSGCEGNAQKLLDSMDAMEGMMNLFYQHKGLNQTAPDEKDRFPQRHLNIRYQRMFAGAFMYAAGDHIGIGWNETAGMMTGVPVQSDNGKYVSGRYFGWGIAHEIGHNINQSAYAYAEVTNNYFAVLAQAKDTNDSVRFEYPKVYEKVTSGTTGKSEDVFTQLGMYWQLHLAYDSGYNFKTYDNYEEQLNNLFFARVDTYARNTAKAPAPQGIALTLSGDRDQDFMRLACAAAQKNILEFFERWGMIPNDETRSYAGQFETETRAIYYVNDDSRVYRLENSGSSLGSLGDVEAVGDDTTVSVNKDTANQVDFTLTSKTIPEEDVLGYEITRTMISGGQVEKEVVGFTTENQFSDHVTTVNNRVITYEVTVVDKYLNRSAAKTLTPVKIEHDGSLDKEFWTTTTKNMEAVHTEDPGEADEDTPCAPQQEAPILKAVDNKTDTTYTGIAGDEAEVLMQFNRKQIISGLKYTVNEGTAIKDYSIYVHGDNDEWTEVVKGSFDDKKVQTVYFENVDGKYVGTYSTDAVKLVIHNQKDTEISISELDVLGVTGDNVDFRSAQDGTSAIGRLASDYQYGETEADKIPAGSIVFVGSYKGNPAYNVVLLYDQDGNIVGGTNTDGSLKAQQIILADVPETGNIQDVSDGTWIYWIDPQDSAQLAGKQVRAELYRVNDAQTNEGQRLVSDSLYVEVPQEMPEIELNGNQ